MLGLIIAAGQGSRLVASVGAPAKPLVRVADRTLVEWAGTTLTYLGATEVIIVCRGVHAAAVEAAYAASGDLAPARIRAVTATTSGLETLLRARDLIAHRPFLLSCVDSVIPQSQLARMKSKVESVEDGTFLVGCTPARNTREGTFVLLERSEIAAIGKTLPAQPLITAGVYGCPDDFVCNLDQAAVARLGHLSSYLGCYCETTKRGTPVIFDTCFDIDTVCDWREAIAYLHRECEQ